jgi:hypothetical protein
MAVAKVPFGQFGWGSPGLLKCAGPPGGFDGQGSFPTLDFASPVSKVNSFLVTGGDK